MRNSLVDNPRTTAPGNTDHLSQIIRVRDPSLHAHWLLDNTLLHYPMPDINAHKKCVFAWSIVTLGR